MEQAFEVASYAMRYWFIALVLVILIAVIYISYKEYQQKKQVMTQVGQFGGYMQIIAGPEEFIGDRFGLTPVSNIGSAGNCDIILPDRTVAPRHAVIYQDGDDYYIQPTGKAETRINDRRAVNTHKLKTGDKLTFGRISLRIYFKRTRIGNDH
ncbi:hypothetical protein CE91St36_22280 [Christensenellaceae bacterium]|nr:hypothetical protein CE91St36_22280 [Christensenellaceae bacterium]BDF62076.1 hypothetical protein CE91St37_22260 [Christensenellaceae bacterium]